MVNNSHTHHRRRVAPVSDPSLSFQDKGLGSGKYVLSAFLRFLPAIITRPAAIAALPISSIFSAPVQFSSAIITRAVAFASGAATPDRVWPTPNRSQKSFGNVLTRGARSVFACLSRSRHRSSLTLFSGSASWLWVEQPVRLTIEQQQMPPKTSTERSQDCRARQKRAEEEKKATRRERDRNRKREKRALEKQQQQEERELERQQQQQRTTMNSHPAQQGHATPNRAREHEEQWQYETREEQYHTPQDRRPQPRQPATMPEMRILQQQQPVLDLLHNRNQIELQNALNFATVFGAPVAGSQLANRDGGAPRSEGRPGWEAHAGGGWNRRSDVRHDHRTDGSWNQRNDGRVFDDGDWNSRSSDHDDGLSGPPNLHRWSHFNGCHNGTDGDHDSTEGDHNSRSGPPPALNRGFHSTTSGSMYGDNHWGATAQSGSSLEARATVIRTHLLLHLGATIPLVRTLRLCPVRCLARAAGCALTPPLRALLRVATRMRMKIHLPPFSLHPLFTTGPGTPHPRTVVTAQTTSRPVRCAARSVQ